MIAYLARYSDTHALVTGAEFLESTIISAFIAEIGCLRGVGIVRAIDPFVTLLSHFAYSLI